MDHNQKEVEPLESESYNWRWSTRVDFTTESNPILQFLPLTPIFIKACAHFTPEIHPCFWNLIDSSTATLL